MGLNDELRAIRAGSLTRLDPALWAGLRDAIERLRMMQLAEHSLAVGDVLPDFALPDAAGRVVESGTLLDRAPLVLAFFRGGWCPYCDLTLRALEAARPLIEAAGGTLVGVAPSKPEELARVAAEKGLRFLLLSDTEGRLAQLCGVLYAMSPGQVAYYRDARGLDLPAIGAGTGWEVPLAASYVVGSDGVIAYAFARADWAERAEPDELLAAVRQLKEAASACRDAGQG